MFGYMVSHFSENVPKFKSGLIEFDELKPPDVITRLSKEQETIITISKRYTKDTKKSVGLINSMCTHLLEFKGPKIRRLESWEAEC